MAQWHSSRPVDDFCLHAFGDLSTAEHQQVLSWRNHSEVRRWMYTPDVIAWEEHVAFVGRLQGDFPHAYWRVDQGAERLGVVYLNRISLVHRQAWLGLYGNPDLVGQGVGAKLGKVLQRLAFADLGLHALRLEVLTDNLRAQRLYARLGFRPEALFRQYVWIGGQPRDVSVMAQLASEWSEGDAPVR